MIRRTSLAAAVSLCLAAGVALASPPSGFNPSISMADTGIISPVNRGRPALTASNSYTTLTEFGGNRMYRVTGDSNTSIGYSNWKWNGKPRHTYSKVQPWTLDGSLMAIDNRDGSSESRLQLNYAYSVIGTIGTNAHANWWDARWLMDDTYGADDRFVNVIADGSQIQLWDKSLDDTILVFTQGHNQLPFKAKMIGAGEGNLSLDNRYMAIMNFTGDTMAVVDWVGKNISPAYKLETGVPEAKNLTISPLGNFVYVKFADHDRNRIYDFNKSSLTITGPHTMDSGSQRCQDADHADETPTPDDVDEWIFPLKHADVTLDPSDGNAEVLIGIKVCDTLGTVLNGNFAKILKVKMSTGAVTQVSKYVGSGGTNREGSASHVSTRNTNLAGWAYVTYAYDDSTLLLGPRRFSGEIVAWKTDGSKSCMRFGHIHSYPQAYTDADVRFLFEAHAVPSPDGRLIAFNSPWSTECGAGHCGLHQNDTWVHTYVIDAKDYTPPPNPCEPWPECDGGGGGHEEGRPNPGGGGAIPRFFDTAGSARSRYGTTAVWFDVMGRKLSGGPTRGGIYIVKVNDVARRVVITN